MKLETSISRIETLTRQNHDENTQYRYLLDICDLSTKDIDTIVRKHYRAVSGEIECRDCGNCCKVFRPMLTASDIDRLAVRLKIPREDFITKYLNAYKDGEEHYYKLTPCPFLVDNACSVYSDRPDACRVYPSLRRAGFVARLDRAFSSCSVCPIVYNVYERVKQEIRDSQPAGLSSSDE
ncbi:MAG: YkgJ family cysteine cluster protein [Candidatus Eisenbacteria bacterium]